MKHQINATITETYIEFRNFPPDCGWFDPIDDLMFLPLSIDLTPDSLCPEYIQLVDGVETYKDSMSEYHGVRWDLSQWQGRDRKKLSWFILQYVTDRFNSVATVVLK